MANHVRKQIRDAAKAALTGLATTGANVFGSRVHPLQDNELPGLTITTGDEEIEPQTFTRPTYYQRTLDLEIRASVKQVDDYEDTVDQILKEVEIALAAAPTLGGACKRLLTSRVVLELSGDGEKPTVEATMTVKVLYITAAGAPDVPH